MFWCVLICIRKETLSLERNSSSPWLYLTKPLRIMGSQCSPAWQIIWHITIMISVINRRKARYLMKCSHVGNPYNMYKYKKSSFSKSLTLRLTAAQISLDK